ncbi:MAG: class I SAM-dependent methyltransferase [Acidobacteria bacterium]|nr:class I SAM-dependent methyltransferase [Acidobacteriota bacterium]
MDVQAWDQIADQYFDQISSPFEPKVVNPLLEFLERLPRRRQKTVADLGCGIGNLLPFLAEKFERVVAVDFSPRMLRLARARCRQQKNIRFHQQSLADLSGFEESFDVAVTVNSVLSPRLSEIDRIFGRIAASLKPGGTLAGIFPSLESVLYEGVLVLDRERRQSASEEQALRRARRAMGRDRYDFLAGVFNAGGDRQKFYYSFELRKRLQDAGFRAIQFGKVLYPWPQASSPAGFLGQPRTWDWFVRARRPE